MKLVTRHAPTPIDSFRSEFDELLSRFFTGEPTNRLPAAFTQTTFPAVDLPENVRLDPDSIVASYKNGMLELTIPKLEPTPAAKIAVKQG
ncbi:MAG: Hsp20 family protein [Planctomycetota bacterium]|nr:Hsp20 family protein [Planctomycetota bacterium]